MAFHGFQVSKVKNSVAALAAEMLHSISVGCYFIDFHRFPRISCDFVDFHAFCGSRVKNPVAAFAAEMLPLKKLLLDFSWLRFH